MRIPKVFHPVLGILTGSILFLAGIGLLSVAFVGMVKAVEYAGAFLIKQEAWPLQSNEILTNEKYA